MLLRVKTTPNASKSALIGWEELPMVGKVLCVRIAAPAVDGKANKALIPFLAKALKVSKSSIQLLKGDHARIKTFEIPDNAELPQE